jgi:hypothetical protein
VISAADLERAERILQVTYRDAELPAQLRGMEVEIEAFNNFLRARQDTIQEHYQQAYRAADPRLHQAYNTLLMHFFLVGVVCGRSEKREII